MDDITNSHAKSNKCSVNESNLNPLNPNTKSFNYTGDCLLDKVVVIPKIIRHATSPITPPLFNVLPKSPPDCVIVAICVTPLLLSVLIIGHVVNIIWGNGYNYIHSKFTSTAVDKSIGSILKDVDISILNTIRSTNPNNVVIGLLNINSFNSKYDAIKLVIQSKIDVMVIVGREPKLIIHLARGRNYYRESPKGQFWDPCCSTFILMICFSFLGIPMYVILLMTLCYMHAIFP